MSETNANITELHAMNPVNTFSGRGTDYRRYRPSYPTAAIDTILEELGNPSQLTAADVGAGTGIGSQLLAERGVRVVAIEPNASMREAAQLHPMVDFRDGTAERTNLPESSVDLLTCFQAFHWFNPTPTLSEFRRILKPSARLALVWNDWVPNDKFFADFGNIVRKVASKHRPGGKHRGAVNPLLSSPDFVHVRRYTFRHTQKLDLFGLIGYARSKSFIPEAESVQQQLVSDLQELHAHWADERDFVSLNYITTVYLAEPQLNEFSKFLTPLQSKFRLGWRRLNQAVIDLLSFKQKL